MPRGRINAENAAAAVEEDCALHAVCAYTIHITQHTGECSTQLLTSSTDAYKTEVLPTTVVNRWYVVQVQGRAREGTAR